MTRWHLTGAGCLVIALAASRTVAAEPAWPDILLAFASDQSHKTDGGYPEWWPLLILPP
jgi:hypothetical protein